MLSDRKLVAFVTGANGITSDYVVRQLASGAKMDADSRNFTATITSPTRRSSRAIHSL